MLVLFFLESEVTNTPKIGFSGGEVVDYVCTEAYLGVNDCVLQVFRTT